MARGSLRLALVGAALVVAGGSVAWFMSRDSDGPSSAARPDPDAMAPEGVRVRVQVMNATSTRGLARRATMHLRDHGYDVVESGNASEQRDSTLVLDRSGNADWARRVALAMGGARVESRPDTSRYLDVTVLVGRAWRAPPQPFYP